MKRTITRSRALTLTLIAAPTLAAAAPLKVNLRMLPIFR